MRTSINQSINAALERSTTVRGRSGLLPFLFIAVLVLVVGAIGYGLGVNAGPAATVVQPVGGVGYPVVYAHGWGFGGFGIFGILFFFLFIGLIFAAIRGGRRWGGGYGPGGYGPWGRRGWGPGPGFGPGGTVDPNDPRVQEWLDKDAPPAVKAMLEAWHQRAHGGTPAAGGPKNTSTI
jgi:hypothetical protein